MSIRAGWYWTRAKSLAWPAAPEPLLRPIGNRILNRAVARPAERGAIAEDMTPAEIAKAERLMRGLARVVRYTPKSRL